MKRLLLLVSLAGASAFAAIAPDSIAGKVYHEYAAIPSVRAVLERTIIFGADGRYVYLKAATGSPLIMIAPNKVFIQTPFPLDGSYTYRRTSDTTGTVDMVPASGTQPPLELNFFSATTGGSPTLSGTPYSFFLSDLTALNSAPVMNVSLRGRVSEGRPLIAGFVVPGPVESTPAGVTVPSPKDPTREILIRVVGPSLAQFGVAGAWADPDFRLFQGSAPASVNEFHYDDWSGIPNFAGTKDPNPAGVAGFKRIFAYLGAFPLLDGSKDSADVVRLSPGAYTIVCNPAAGDAGGEVLIEVYFLP